VADQICDARGLLEAAERVQSIDTTYSAVGRGDPAGALAHCNELALDGPVAWAASDSEALDFPGCFTVLRRIDPS
jgi:hypothetical protein